MKYKESDLYLPVKNFFEEKNFVVKSEVKDCDVVALKDDQVVVIELKLNFNIGLIFQALDRQKISNEVYVCVPRLKGLVGYRNMKKMIKLCSRLGLGLFFVSLDSVSKNIELAVLPDHNGKIVNKKKNLVLNEHKGRTFDLNLGGMNKTMITTAYRERIIKLGCIMLIELESSSAEIMKKYNLEKNPYQDFRSNIYGWFEKAEGRGKFKLSKKGILALASDENKILVEHYNKYFNEN